MNYRPDQPDDALPEDFLPPRRRWSDLLEELDRRFVSWQKAFYLFVGACGAILVLGFPTGWVISAYIGDRKSFETAMTKTVTGLEVQREREIPKLDSVNTGIQQLRNEIKQKQGE